MISGRKSEIKKINQIINLILKKRIETNFVTIGDSPEAGHFVKICHNAIEYSLMRILSEYFLLNKEIFKQNTTELTNSFKKINTIIPNFYLGKISEKIVKKIDSNLININNISDKIGHNSTSKWYNLLCLENDISCPSLLMSFENRILSKSKKNITYKINRKKTKSLSKKNFDKLFKFLFILCYMQGITSLKKLCKIKKIKIKIKNILKVWKFDSIITSDILNLNKVITSEEFINFYSPKDIKNFMAVLSDLIKLFISNNYNPAGLFSCYNLIYNQLNTVNKENSFIQIQRNFFGNHKLESN